ncbi:MAG: ABC transporter ATP-binding protein [Candidatus Omnitrophica bacterium]|nr:ABC transporter ATP-binding protein [Candidatus Omnitrophota bacterium]
MLLEIRKLSVDFETRAECVMAVRDVSLSLAPGEAVGLVGESGSGKTTLGLAITRLLSSPPAVIRTGEIWFDGQDLLRLPIPQLSRIRGGQIAYVFQEPSTSLNPVMTVGRQLIEMLEWHTALRGHAARQRAVELLAHVGIPAPAERLGSFPHELSGGMKQRVMIAMAIASTPKILVADEPTTALDVTLERQIILLLKRLQRELALSLLVISHNIHLLKQVSDRLVVMWQGSLVEEGPTAEVLAHPRHAYTQRLLAAQPKVAI